MEIRNLLPIGSVVLLCNGEKRLMIYGIKQREANGGEREFDYVGVLYPEGYISDEFTYLFDHKDIVEICFRGYEDPERTDFLSRLSTIYNGQ